MEKSNLFNENVSVDDSYNIIIKKRILKTDHFKHAEEVLDKDLVFQLIIPDVTLQLNPFQLKKKKRLVLIFGKLSQDCFRIQIDKQVLNSTCSKILPCKRLRSDNHSNFSNMNIDTNEKIVNISYENMTKMTKLSMFINLNVEISQDYNTISIHHQRKNIKFNQNCKVNQDFTIEIDKKVFYGEDKFKYNLHSQRSMLNISTKRTALEQFLKSSGKKNFSKNDKKIDLTDLSKELYKLCNANSNNVHRKHSGSGDEEKVLVNYTFKIKQGRQNSIEILYKDYHKLDEGIYLNDTIIYFYLKYLEGELADTRLRDKLLIFDTFFYHKLSNPGEEGDLDAKLVNYLSVKKWTKNFDVFEKEYTLIPINEFGHWSLIIICNPMKISKIFHPEEDSHNKSSSTEELQEAKIIYLDSWFLENKRCVSIFKKFLFYEYSKKNHIFAEDTEEEQLVKFIEDHHDQIATYSPLVPKQNNSYDCGIFLLVYAELFLYNPDYLLINMNCGNMNLSGWFDIGFASGKRKAIKKLIYELSKEKNREQAGENYKNERNNILMSMCFLHNSSKLKLETTPPKQDMFTNEGDFPNSIQRFQLSKNTMIGDMTLI